MGLPCVSLYRLAPLNYMIGRALVHVEHFTLPNILLGETIQPELLQDEVEPHRSPMPLARLYRGEAAREKTRAKLQEPASGSDHRARRPRGGQDPRGGARQTTFRRIT